MTHKAVILTFVVTILVGLCQNAAADDLRIDNYEFTGEVASIASIAHQMGVRLTAYKVSTQSATRFYVESIMRVVGATSTHAEEALDSTVGFVSPQSSTEFVVGLAVHSDGSQPAVSVYTFAYDSDQLAIDEGIYIETPMEFSSPDPLDGQTHGVAIEFEQPFVLATFPFAGANAGKRAEFILVFHKESPDEGT